MKFFFLFSSACKSYVYTTLWSTKCAIALCLRKQYTYLKIILLEKMAPLDLLNAGLPQTFNLYKTQLSVECNIYLSICIYIYIYICIYVYVCIYVCVCISMYLSIYIWKLQAHSKYWRSVILRVGKEVDWNHMVEGYSSGQLWQVLFFFSHLRGISTSSITLLLPRLYNFSNLINMKWISSPFYYGIS